MELLEKEMERLKGEMQDWRAPKETEGESAPRLPLPAGDSSPPPPAPVPQGPPATGEE